MNNMDQINIDGTLIDGGLVSCTGKQLTSILETIKGAIVDCQWFVVDILSPGQYVIQPYTGKKGDCQVPLKLGDTTNMINFAATVYQFEKGLFLCVSSNKTENIQWNTSVFDTENPDFIEPSELIIRAFDTSFFEIVSKRKNVIQILQNRYNLKVT
jgi:hypothetical protein